MADSSRFIYVAVSLRPQHGSKKNENDSNIIVSLCLYRYSYGVDWLFFNIEDDF